MKKRKVLITIALIIVIFIILIFIIFISLKLYCKKNINLEYDNKLFEDTIGYSSTIFYANANVEKTVYTPVRIDTPGYTKRLYYGIDEIPSLLIDGFVSVEDRAFYSHSGVNFRRTLMAAVNHLLGRKNVFGASTITQQVVKNISGDNEISVRRKIIEMLRSYNIEKRHTKSEIMEVYLNIIPMGNGVIGVGAASKYYFNKEPAELTVAEVATLIGITNAPTAYNPYVNYDKCLQKRNIVLSAMLDFNVIALGEYKEAIQEPIILSTKVDDSADSWFIETVISDVSRDYAKKMKISESLSRLLIMSGGYSIYTTVDMRIQSTLEEFFEDASNFSKEIYNGLNYSMIVLDPHNGDILGIIGGAQKKKGNRLLNQALIPHVPASTLKPIALYAPLIEEKKINWSTVFDDVPLDFIKVGEGYKDYPKNSPPVYDGLITVKDAIKKSKNTVAARLYGMLGAEKIYNNLKVNYKFDSLVEKEYTKNGELLTDLAMAPMSLGQLTKGVSLRKLTEAYTAFSNDGMRSDSRSYILVKDNKNAVVLSNDISSNRVFSGVTAKIMNQLLSEVVESGTASVISLKEKTAVAGKTGTSSNSYDKVFVGYTPRLTAGIWCGYGNNTEIIGVSPSHLEIWDKVMGKVYEKCYYKYENETFDTTGLICAPYCMDSGKQSSHSCIYDPRGSRVEYGYFAYDDTSYQSSCDRHIIVNYDTKRKGVVLNVEECGDNIAKVSLVKNEGRSFPKEVYITDAEYVYRDVNLNNSFVPYPNKPYFYALLEKNEYAGISNKKKQFNSLPLDVNDE